MLKTNPYKNALLALLPASDLDKLKPHLASVLLSRRTQLEMPNKKIGHIYFPESGIVSIVASGAPGLHVEVGIIGREGMTGLPVVLLNDRHPYSVYIQVESTAQRIESSAVQAAMKQSEECRRVFLGFAQSFLTQIAETAVSNVKATVEERLARWLLMEQDRVQNDEIPLTHEFLALMMGARRAGVTEGIHELARLGLIAGRRGVVTIIDRDGLQERAGRYYGLPERERKRLAESK